MAVLVVGADRLGNICDKLHSEGIDEIIHWKGRCHSCDKACAIPRNVEMVIVIYDFINHCFMEHIKKQAKKRGVPVIYSKRALSDLNMKISNTTLRKQIS